LQVKLCDPCLSALSVPPWPKRHYINTVPFLRIKRPTWVEVIGGCVYVCAHVGFVDVPYLVRRYTDTLPFLSFPFLSLGSSGHLGSSHRRVCVCRVCGRAVLGTALYRYSSFPFLSLGSSGHLGSSHRRVCVCRVCGRAVLGAGADS